MLKQSTLQHLFSILLVVLFVLLFSGCQVVKKLESYNGILDDQPPDSELGMLFEAESAYFAENYTLAEDLFTTMQSQSDKPLYVNAALYGLACISIATAKNSEELMQGFAMLEKWNEPGADVLRYEENPKMIAVALNKQLGLLQCEPEIQIVTTNKKETLLKESQEEVRQLKSTIKKLEHQISVLEAIDQEVQEKRQP